jgi:hypothetical protein
MSAGASPTGGIGGIFYFFLLIAGVIQSRDKNGRLRRAKYVLPATLVAVVCVIITMNFVFWSILKYNFSLPEIILPTLGLFEVFIK